jgi:hypothetical protein
MCMPYASRTLPAATTTKRERARYSDQMPNRLARERSPYLLQHAENPVDWYAWGDEAFEKARREDKPIFLSIGYSTCHWCHVMEHESFESPDIAGMLNRDFISIKVDREERPDVDRVYMTFVQATTGSGGWPMSVWLTPGLKPFYGGTYYPPTSRWGRPGFSEVLAEIARVWKTERERIDRVADDLLARVVGATGARRAEGPPVAEQGTVPSAVAGPDALAIGVEQFRHAYDARRGGFGEAPKFPRPSELLFLLRAGAEDMVLHTLRAMALGGMRDHIGGGFHRYSVDAAWRVPHFEKMLYDQAQLVLAYLEAGQVSRRGAGTPGSNDADFYTGVAQDTLDYVLRDLTDARGGFYSAEDADSVPPDAKSSVKSEGAFYLWKEDEIAALLGEDADIVRKRFGIEPGGNAPHDPQGEFTGRNILYIDQPVEDIAIRTGRPPEAVVEALARARRAMSDARARRPRPHLDDKILTAWNGLMIAAFARAARGVEAAGAEAAARYLEAARRAARFIRAELWRPPVEGGPERPTLLRRYRAGDAAIDGYCEDYACLIWGLLELFQADGDPAWLEWAIALQEAQTARFWDDEDGGWFSTTGRDPTVLLRLKEEYDGAEPSPGSVATMNLIWLAHLSGRREYAEGAERTLARYGPRIGDAARALPFMLAALATWQAGVEQIVIVGHAGREDTRALRAAAARRYRPFAVVIPVEPGDHQASLARLMPFVGPMTMRDGQATAYVCRDFVCKEPTTDPAMV